MLVDDHVLFRSSLAQLIGQESDLAVVGVAISGHEAVARVHDIRPDLVLMDINMQNGDGIWATRLLKEQDPDLKVCMLTASDDDEFLLEAIRAGAQGYLIKHMDPQEFVQEIRRQLYGDPIVSEEVAAKIVRAVSSSERPKEWDGDPLSAFTARETDVLKWVGQGKTNRQIAEILGIAENTVKNHLRNILQKLHLDNRVQVAAFAIRRGLADD